MKQAQVVFDTHTLRFPFANVIFGRVFEMPCDVVFEYSESTDQYQVNITSLTGTGEDGATYDMLHLTDDDESMYSEFIINCILSNRKYWDFDDTGEKEWWE